MPDRRRTFGPVVGLGLSAAALAAVAGARPWVTTSVPDAPSEMASLVDDGEMALAATTSWVLLAVWGVVLVTRGRARRLTAALGVAAALGYLAVVGTGAVRLPDSVAESARELLAGEVATELTAWFWAAAVAGVVSLVATSLGVLWCPAWPEMGSRYDAPRAAGAGPDGVPPEEQSNLDLWKQLDEGRDPTT